VSPARKARAAAFLVVSFTPMTTAKPPGISNMIINKSIEIGGTRTVSNNNIIRERKLIIVKA
jgi:hypothetical protein